MADDEVTPTGHYLRTEAGNVAHVRGDAVMSPETVAMLQMLIDRVASTPLSELKKQL